jgi:colicin import membrane protein
VPRDVRDSADRPDSDWEDAFETTEAGQALEDYYRTEMGPRLEEEQQALREKRQKRYEEANMAMLVREREEADVRAREEKLEAERVLQKKQEEKKRQQLEREEKRAQEQRRKAEEQRRRECAVEAKKKKREEAEKANK